MDCLITDSGGTVSLESEIYTPATTTNSARSDPHDCLPQMKDCDQRTPSSSLLVTYAADLSLLLSEFNNSSCSYHTCWYQYVLYMYARTLYMHVIAFH